VLMINKANPQAQAPKPDLRPPPTTETEIKPEVQPQN
jgi:hypothetical protein